MIKSVRYCPRSSLTLSGDESLFEQKLSPLFTTGYSLLGGSVIYSRPEGIADEKSMGLCIDINQAIADEILSERNSYIQIEDYAELQDSSSRARRLMIDYYNNINRCAALIFCNLSIAFRTAVKLGTPLIKRSFPILIAHDYAQAVEWAIEICEREEIELDRVEPPLAYRPGSHSLLSLKYDFLPGDSGRTAGSVALLNDRILHFTLAPVLNEGEVTSLEEKSQILMGRINRAMGDADYILADCGDLKEIHSPVRKFVIHRIREILNQERKPVFILYNTGSVIAAFVKLVLPLVAITVKMAATRDEALRKALEEISMTPRHEPRKPKKSETAMNKLLALTASIKWDQPGLQLPDSIKNEPEMQSIREVLILIKEEVDYLFQEKSRTEQKLQEMVISLSEAQRKLIQNEKYTALGQLSAGMAHNINNSLTIIQGYVDLMQQDDNLRKSQLGYLEDITDTVQYSSMILGKLLSYSKKGKVKPEDRDLNRYLSEIRPELASLLPEGISLDCQIF